MIPALEILDLYRLFLPLRATLTLSSNAKHVLVLEQCESNREGRRFVRLIMQTIEYEESSIIYCRIGLDLLKTITIS
jgi:hypothetical protein